MSGQIAEENKFAKVGQFHTLDLELQRNFTLEKAEGWDSVALEVVREAVNPQKAADAVAVVMQEGLANICFITQHQTVLRQRVETSIPRKRQGRAGDHDKVGRNEWSGLGRFNGDVLIVGIGAGEVLSADARHAPPPDRPLRIQTRLAGIARLHRRLVPEIHP